MRPLQRQDALAGERFAPRQVERRPAPAPAPAPGDAACERAARRCRGQRGRVGDRPAALLALAAALDRAGGGDAAPLGLTIGLRPAASGGREVAGQLQAEAVK